MIGVVRVYWPLILAILLTAGMVALAFEASRPLPDLYHAEPENDEGRISP